ncbi:MULTISPECIES: UDP-N-acetylmuramoyl-tripeptide--D-alanyl-D-alanine ligase [Gordonia]|uniref:UDP-N-acetylmuramoyl-tripeptide--D-alanyl-D- alanine ligase n=1 Tax=Gordonia TaxID=2053 RepID=UPI002042EC2B|nr:MULTISPECIES: UDP-N-acetylmuramoyl-tripeptide--D-alanyl-D-alanine ligase [Gordonia]MCM3895551.1 UDP-N-acetylmuramoyl-tripeptide--D-alanyl-D-alanine ligase [Gordonia sputi]
MSPDGGQEERRVVIVPADVETVSRAIRELVSRARDSSERVRTWAIIGDMDTRDGLTENERVVEHDRVGRLAVRLAVDKTLCVGESRAVRALHQGAVMEGSWGDEARLVETVDDAAATLDTDEWRPAPDDMVLVAGVDPALADLAAGSGT